MTRITLSVAVAVSALATLLSPDPASACSRILPFSSDELFAADVIVRATAVTYVVAPEPNTMPMGEPMSAVEFKVEEVLKGDGVPDFVVLNASLSDRDDFNDGAVPYQFVRRNGRSGNCYASSYKEGAQFLLFLRKSGNGFTSNISPLGPTNEQLRGPGDEWLRWVKQYRATKGRTEN